MKAFLLDLARDNQDNRRKDWMKQIREMAYDCEDCIDDFAHRLPKDSSNLLNTKCWPRWMATLIYDLTTCWPRREIACNIAELKVRAQLIAERRVRYGVKEPDSSGSMPADAPPENIAEDQLARRDLTIKEPVGMGHVMADLERWVKHDEQGAGGQRAVASIVGFGGVGKTTVAMALYKKVMKDFDCRAWVTVSQNYDIEAVLREILKQINPDYMHQDGGTAATISEKTKTNRTASASIACKLLNRALNHRTGHTHGGGTAGSSKKNDTSKAVMEHLKGKRYYILLCFPSIHWFIPCISLLLANTSIILRVPCADDHHVICAAHGQGQHTQALTESASYFFIL